MYTYKQQTYMHAYIHSSGGYCGSHKILIHTSYIHTYNTSHHSIKSIGELEHSRRRGRRRPIRQAHVEDPHRRGRSHPSGSIPSILPKPLHEAGIHLLGRVLGQCLAAPQGEQDRRGTALDGLAWHQGVPVKDAQCEAEGKTFEIIY